MYPWLLVLVLLIASCTGQFGEYCHGWTDSYGGWHPGFQCPERYDPSEATYCCGSCSLRYCCIASESRLDQGLCPIEDEDEMTEEGVPAVDLPASVPTFLPFLLVGSLFVSFVIIGSLVGFCCCKCLNPEQEAQSGGPAQQSRLLDTEASTDNSRHSSSSSASVPRTSLANHPQNLCSLGAENINLYMNVPTAFPIMGCPPNAQFMHPATTGTPYVQPPYINYAVPAEHAILMAPTSYIDARNCFPQSVYAQLNHHVDSPVTDESPKC
ncbi:protein shisa-1-like [Hyperolius riggenbachi]|uniref:protein shisa-1-like n=1 Tax=Hyperolius riggenbachi TaxID=752182 RepID=UPI0035A3C6EA